MNNSLEQLRAKLETVSPGNYLTAEGVTEEVEKRILLLILRMHMFDCMHFGYTVRNCTFMGRPFYRVFRKFRSQAGFPGAHRGHPFLLIDAVTGGMYHGNGHVDKANLFNDTYITTPNTWWGLGEAKEFMIHAYERARVENGL